jgi:hypothetical protein
VLLLVWSAFVALAAGFGYLLFGGPLVPGLLLMGGVLAVSLWWGPGSRRLRVPTRRLVLAATSNVWAGWLGVALVGTAALLCLLALRDGGVVWDPYAGPPWRAGTLLGDLLRWF